MLLFFTVSGRCECLRPGQRETYRPADFAGREHGERDVRPNHCLGAEAAAEPRDGRAVRSGRCLTAAPAQTHRCGSAESRHRATIAFLEGNRPDGRRAGDA
jgi:hypothetical protein